MPLPPVHHHPALRRPIRIRIRIRLRTKSSTKDKDEDKGEENSFADREKRPTSLSSVSMSTIIWPRRVCTTWRPEGTTRLLVPRRSRSSLERRRGGLKPAAWFPPPHLEEIIPTALSLSLSICVVFFRLWFSVAIAFRPSLASRSVLLFITQGSLTFCAAQASLSVYPCSRDLSSTVGKDEF